MGLASYIPALKNGQIIPIHISTFNAPYPVQYINDGSCYKYGCTADWAENFDPIATDDDESCFLNACMSEWADNYNSNATSDDGSCLKKVVC